MKCTIQVNGDDPRWKSINEDDYNYVNDNLTIEDFPVKPGKRTIEYEVIEFDDDKTTQEIMEEIKKRGLRLPDRAEAETILDDVEGEYIIGICGVVQSDARSRSVVGSVGSVVGFVSGDASGDASGRFLRLRVLRFDWPRHYRFVAVVSESSDTGNLGTSLESRVLELEEFKKRVEKVLNV